MSTRNNEKIRSTDMRKHIRPISVGVTLGIVLGLVFDNIAIGLVIGIVVAGFVIIWQKN